MTSVDGPGVDDDLRIEDDVEEDVDDSLAYFEWSAPDDSEHGDRRAWAWANPALGIRITERWVKNERRLMESSPESFARERLGIWEDVTRGGVFDRDAWEALKGSPEDGIVGAVVFGVDVTPDRTRAAITVAGRRADGHKLLETVAHELGTEWVVQSMLDRRDRLLEREGPGAAYAFAIAPNSPAGSLIAAAEAAGLTVTTVSQGDYAQACGALFDAVKARTVHHLGQTDLTAAVMGCRKKERGEGDWTWDRRHAGVDISPLCAGTIGAHVLDDMPAVEAPPEFFDWQTLEQMGADTDASSTDDGS